MFSNPIIGLVELVHEEERIGCKKISVGVCKLKNTCKEGYGYLKNIYIEVHMKKKRMMKKKEKEWGKEEEKGMMRC